LRHTEATAKLLADQLARSLEWDPEDRETHLRLIGYYRRGKRAEDVRRLLDEATGRWPKDMQVLDLGGGTFDVSVVRTEIGSFRIEGLSDAPAGNVIVTTFSLDVNGILHVTSREKRTGLEKHIIIDNATARFEEQEPDAARERLSALIGGEAEPAPGGEPARRESVQARALVEKAERLMGSANAQDKDDLVDLVEAVQDALAQGDAEALDRAVAGLTDLVFFLES